MLMKKFKSRAMGIEIPLLCFLSFSEFNFLQGQILYPPLR